MAEIPDRTDPPDPTATDPSERQRARLAALATRQPPRGQRAGRWMRLFHVYVSMGSMLVVAFFALTGLTLNHPDWSLGSTTTTTAHGTLPAGSVTGRTVDYLKISEYARDAFGITGHVKDYGVSGDTGTIDYAGPGSSASVMFSLGTSTVTATVTQNDLLAVLNDIHKGRDTNRSWSWVIDVSAVVLLVVTLTGIGIQLFQRKRRTSALVTAGVLAVVTLVLMYVATR